jgi:EAL domain-containing protein (putative c-di-GMP-specific phosphodiesterase class I)
VFIPIAEKTGLIQEIGFWVLRTACAQAVKWRDSGYQFEHIAVNVAGPQLQRDNFAQLVISVLEEAGLEAKFIELEVTEGFMVSNAEEAMKQLDILSEYGISLAMDDFGTGYSSLSYLQQLPLDKIKIDQSFVKSLPDNSQDTAIANAIIALGTSLSLRVIAEGVESEEQVEFLTERGCFQAQGYYFSPPLSGDELTTVLSKTAH